MESDGVTKLYPPFRELLKVAQQWAYGSFHSHDEIAEILGIAKGTSAYYSAIRYADDGLLRFGKKLEVVIGKGYVVINPDEFIAASNKKVKKSEDFYRRGYMIAVMSPRNKMSAGVRQCSEEHLMAMSRGISIRAAENQSLFELQRRSAALKQGIENPKVLSEGENKDENN